MSLTLNIATYFSTWHCNLLWCFTIPSLIKMLSLHYDLDLEQSNIFTRKWLMMIYQQTKSDGKWFIRLEDIVEMFTLYLYSWTLTVTLTLKIATHFLYMMLWFIVMLHHTKFGYKRLVEKIWSGQNLDGWIHRHRDCSISPWLHYAGYNNNQNTK